MLTSVFYSMSVKQNEENINPESEIIIAFEKSGHNLTLSKVILERSCVKRLMTNLFYLQDDTTTLGWVIVCADLVLVAVNIVDMAVTFPLVVHLGDRDKFNCLPLKRKKKKRHGNDWGSIT